ncbi:hypothetical protein HD806DRAFT_523379 [Xylariaceae sp. AK1471]|nr:hypothetical protein HD806DRAFT_523379 [Xylariaceae sp. AK1471]
MDSNQSNLGRRKRGSVSPSKSSAIRDTISTKNPGPCDRAFQQHLIDHEGRRCFKASTISSISPSCFSNEDFRKFKRAESHASEEQQVASTVVPIIEGDVGDSKCLHRQIRTELEGHIVPSTQHDLPIAPNFFLAAKGPDDSPAVVERQACYDGALGARAIRSLQTYAKPKPEPDNKAYTITSIYHVGALKIYTSHPLPPTSPGAASNYVTTQIGSWRAGAYRNVRDWAKRQRDEAIRKANERVICDELPPTPPPNFA